MKKSELMELVRSYHACVNSESLLSHAPYQKGWVKRLFNTQTLGMHQVQQYLESTSIQALHPDEELERDALIELLKIMMDRERRIVATSRSYEAAPDKSTNRVYQRLAHLLILQYSMLEDIGLDDYPGKALLMEFIQTRCTNQLISELEHNASALCAATWNVSPSETGCAPYRRLGLAHLFGHQLHHQFKQQPISMQNGMSCHRTTLHLHETVIECELFFLNGAPYETQLVRGEMHFKRNVDEGLRWLEKAALYADPKACMILASFYARRDDFATLNTQVNRNKALDYLDKAQRFGSKLATQVLEHHPLWGEVVINGSPDDTEYRLKPIR